MDLRRIDELLKKYHEGETTLEEERALSDFFNSEDVPPQLEAEKIAFGFYAREAHEHAPHQGVRLSAAGPAVRGGRKMTLPKFRIAAIAAGVLLIAGAILYTNKDAFLGKTSRPPGNNTEAAYAQTKQALLLVSVKLNKGAGSLCRIGKLNEVQTLLTRKNKG